MNASTQQLVTYGIRGAQLLFSFLLLALSAAFIGDIHNFDGFHWNDGRVSFTLAISILTLIYFAFIGGALPFSLANTTYSVVILVLEAWFTLVWLISFALVADNFGSFSCFDVTWCKIGKSLIPFALFNWLLFTASLVLLIIFTIVPSTKVQGASQHFKSKTTFNLGAIFAATIPVKGEEGIANPAANEANVGINTSDDEPREVKDQVTTTTSLDHHPNDVVLDAPVGETTEVPSKPYP
ncbi:membrane-associating domain-containing protein [Scheffersomyces xylosifermentans]|uniref:membrane-associating domain-containing protein n=1 Tax=Scheffersomyces xylosifermentans TaxID=1304137 RepID=UPI00315C688C